MKETNPQLLQNRSGIGKRKTEYLQKLGLNTVFDVLQYFPRKYIDRRKISTISEAILGQPTVIMGKIESPERKRTYKSNISLFTATINDGNNTATLTWFNKKGIEYILKEGTPIAIHGVPKIRNTQIEITNPDFQIIQTETDKKNYCGIIPLYPLTNGITEKWYRKLATEILQEYLPQIEETLPYHIIKKRNLMSLKEAIQTMHTPQTPERWKEARKRLAYEELLTLQSAVQIRKNEIQKNKNIYKIKPGEKYKQVKQSIPFTLTNDQEKVILEIQNDIAKEIPMARLIQGDVGSGKTLIAILTAAATADCEIQTAILAPTEVLAEQLYKQAQKWLHPHGIESVLIKSSLKTKERNEVLEKTATGQAKIIVGTQALLENRVKYKKLGMVIIDEQQRFGVEQRAKLINRENPPHMLLMSATPIPRTLSMTLFADLEISTLKDKPKNQKKRETRIINEGKMPTLLQFILNEIKTGGQIYWICPRVEENEEEEIASVEKRYKFLQKHLGITGVGLIHGKIPSEKKENELTKFIEGKNKILVGTTVLEVGVDVPQASVIVIENPEMYGLSQLHQLRGRIGRGEKRGVCILLTPNNETTNERLKIIEKTEDGFEIAEEDMKNRGFGKIGGTEQHGETGLKIADLRKDLKLLEQTKEDAIEILEKAKENKENEKFLKKMAKYEKNNLRIG
ncbi:MAG: ATP-dependent DNA helicase RecG [Synergistaceae bacterium]